MKEIKTISRLDTTVKIPGSKSITHRAVIAAGLAHGESLIENFLDCEDTQYTIDALRTLDVPISIEGYNLNIYGRGGNFSRVLRRKELFLGNSGTSYRLLLSALALGQGEYIITGSPRMLKRPIGALVAALNQLGVQASCVDHGGYPPVLIRADGIRGGKVHISGNQSSQFVSSLLLSAPYAEKDIEIQIKDELVSRFHVDMTLDVMYQFGIQVDRDGYRYFRIPSGRHYRPGNFSIQGDVSSASYFWAAAAVCGGTVATKNIDALATRQGDIRFLDILEQMGCIVVRNSDRVVVHGRRLYGVDADMNTMPDIVPTLAAIALFADGKTYIRGVHHLRYKESNRLKAIALEWHRLGGRVEETHDGLIIYGQKKLKGVVVDPHDDHRLAMSLAAVGLRVPGIRIKNEKCVNKSFPQFWELWDRL
jgi:3-phosphoshikimate 1-carboxyvinyltransferase